MKIRHILFFFLLSAVFSCSTKHEKTEATAPVTEQPKVKEQLKSGIVIPSVTCDKDASQSYALYLPSNYSDTAKFPVIIFFDPHAAGNYPVGLYKSLADRFGYILMGSDNSKNGLQFGQTNAIVNTLIDEAASKFSSDNKRITLAGFSGGAKVALVGSSDHPELLSVIYCGAAIPYDNNLRLPPSLGFAGNRDMNYTEVLTFGQTLNGKLPSEIMEWNGKHEWPDSSSFEDAFYWCSFTAMRKTLTATDHSLVKSFLARKNKLISSTRDVLKQFDTYRQVVSFLDGLTDVSPFQGRYKERMKSASYINEIQKKQKTLRDEDGLKQGYAACFETKDIDWWREEVARMKTIKNGNEGGMYQRLLGYLSLAAYSYSNNALKQGNLDAAVQYLAIYDIADPGNFEQSFLTACLYARQGDQEKAIAALEEAVRLGLKDKNKVLTEESFSGLRGTAKFNDVLNKL